MADVMARAPRRGGQPAAPLTITREERARVEALLRRTKLEKRVFLRASALLLMVDGMPSRLVAWRLHVHERTAEKWRRRFLQGPPVAKLADAHLAEACRPPQDVGVPVTQWSISLLAEHLPSVGLCISETSVRRILTSARLQPHRQKMWLHSQDDEFRDKRDAILRLYYESPSREHIICLDEKTGIQALERRYADVPMKPGSPVKREFEYIRHGTLVLMGAFDVRAGKAFGFLDEHSGSEPFVALLDGVDACYPTGKGHLVCDNLSAHQTEDVLDWLDEHPRWTLHFTPKHGSWLNQIEQFFSILHRRVIVRGSFASKADLADKITNYLVWHNDHGRPFRWSYRPASWRTNPAELSAA